MYRANPSPDHSSDTLVSARVSPGTEHAWWPAVLPAVPPAGVPGGFQPGDWKWVTLLGMDGSEWKMRMIKPLTGETFKEDAWNMFRHLVQLSKGQDKAIHFKRCMFGVRALVLAWERLQAKGLVSNTSPEQLYDLLGGYLHELTDNMSKGSPLLWTTVMLEESRAKVVNWSRGNPTAELDIFQMLGAIIFKLGERVQVELAARRMQQQVSIDHHFKELYAHAQGGGSNVTTGAMPTMPFGSYAYANEAMTVVATGAGGMTAALSFAEPAPDPSPAPQAALPATFPAEAEDALAGAINSMHRPVEARFDKALIIGLEAGGSSADKMPPASESAKKPTSSTKKKWKEMKASLSPVKINSEWDAARNRSKPRKLEQAAPEETGKQSAHPWSCDEIELLIRGVRKHAGAIDIWMRIHNDPDYELLCGKRSRGAMSSQWNKHLCKLEPELPRDFAQWRQTHGKNATHGAQLQDKKQAIRKHLSIDDILARDPKEDEELKKKLMMPEELETDTACPWNVREAYPSLFQKLEESQKEKVVKQAKKRMEPTAPVVKQAKKQMEPTAPDPPEDLAGSRNETDEERMARYACEDLWLEDIDKRWSEMPKVEQNAARKERKKIKDRQYRMRAKSIKQGMFEAGDDANADMGAKIEKLSPKIGGSNPITELPGATKAKSSAPAEAPGSGKGSSLPIVEKLTREQKEICKQHILELQKRLKDELNVKMDRRWRAVYVETESGEVKTRFIAPSGKRLCYIPRCVEYVKREGQPGPDPKDMGNKEKYKEEPKPKAATPSQTKAKGKDDDTKSLAPPQTKQPAVPKDKPDGNKGKRPCAATAEQVPSPTKKVRTSRTARAVERELCIIEQGDEEKDSTDPELLALKNDDIRESMVARVKPGVRPEEILRGDRGVLDAMDTQGGIILRHDVVIQNDHEIDAAMSATNQNSGLKDVWVWLRCVWRNLQGVELGNYVAKNSNVTRVTYVCQSFVRHPRLTVTRIDINKPEEEDDNEEDDDEEDDGWGWGVNLAKPVGEVTIAQPIITVREREIDSSAALYADWREYSYIINKETVGDTKQPRVDSGMLPDGSVAREKRPQGEIFVDDIHESLRCSGDHLKLMGPTERERYFFMLLRTGFDLRFQYLKIESDVEFDASNGTAQTGAEEAREDSPAAGRVFDNEVYVRRSERRRSNTAPPEREPKWWKSSSADKKKQYTPPRHPWDPRLLPFAEGFATRAIAAAAARALGSKPVSVVPKLRYCSAFALIPMRQESYGMGSSLMMVPEKSTIGSIGTWVVWYTVPRRGVPFLHRFLKAHLGRDGWFPNNCWSSSKLHRKIVEVGYDSGKDLYDLSCLQGDTHWCDPAAIAAYNKDVRSGLKVPVHRHVQAAGEHFHCDYGAVRWGVCLSPGWIITTPFAASQDWLKLSRNLDKRLQEWEKHIDADSDLSRGPEGIPNFTKSAWLLNPDAMVAHVETDVDGEDDGDEAGPMEDAIGET